MWRCLALALLLGVGCARRTEIIGRAGGDASPDLAGDAAAPTFPPLACTPDQLGPAVAPVDWNCGPTCFRDINVPEGTSFELPADTAASSKPRVAYPLTGATIPVNLTGMTVQWRRGMGAGQTAFRIRIAAVNDPTQQHELQASCQPPTGRPTPPAQEECTYPVPARVWASIAAARIGSEVTLSLLALDPGKGLTAAADPVLLSFTPAALGGGVYVYSNGQQGIVRGVLGAGTNAAQPFVSSAAGASRFTCYGCHGVSEDGRVLGFVAEQPGYLTVAPTEAITRPSLSPPATPQSDAATLSLNRDGSLVAVSYGSGAMEGRLVVRETAGGREVARLDPAVLGTVARKLYFPDWSPDGRELVATLASTAEAAWSVNDGSIVVIPYNGGAFGPARVVVPSGNGLFHFYPSWSPDGAWIAFASAPLPGKSYANRLSRLRLVGRDGGTVYELARATQAVGKTSSWPRFVPFRQADCNLMFLTLSTKADYGYLLANSIHPQGGWSQVWLAAVDLRRLGSGDPSSAPVWLPFQDIQSPSLFGAWTERLVCGPSAECPLGSTCQGGACLADPP